LYGDVPRIELFSRSAAPGWSHWGNQCAAASVELIPGCAIDVVKTEAA
ncbi:DNA methyltransferase, partial [Klebsiella pneumoniae]